MALIIPYRGERVLRENIRKLDRVIFNPRGLRNVKEEELDEYIVIVFSGFEESTIRHIYHTRDNVRNEAPRRENYPTEKEFLRAQSDIGFPQRIVDFDQKSHAEHS
ncbi:hypothetical protein Glove_13g8 [Diversispora epigaea]|uniref:Uncharacterized protein n=1 Tax=Diversispora epigaea TaxID=1348612 RepID=A0A397JPT5_9GLOM|nr:hypothetical protein Glove_13g8 [Diversispora epigaea]